MWKLRISFLLLVPFFFCFYGCKTVVQEGETMINKSTLDYFRKLGKYTEPGPYAEMYKNLPQAIPEICTVFNHQIIHVFALDQYKDKLPEGRTREDEKLSTVQEMLAELKRRNPKGLVLDRLPEERIVVACRNYALFLASILKYRNIPSRVRAGFAPYLDKEGKYIDHWICEHWDKEAKRWKLVDPDVCDDTEMFGIDFNMYDIPRDKFEFSADAWIKARKGLVSPELYGVMDMWGMWFIRDNLCHDLLCITGEEVLYWEGPPITKIEMENMKDDDLILLDTVAQLLRNPDKNLVQLHTLLKENRELRMSD